MNYLYICILIFCSCKKDNLETKNEIILNCLIFTTGSTSEIYLFKVFENGELEVTFGEKDSNLESANFKNVIWQNKSIITTNNFKLIKQYNIELNSLRNLKRENLKKGGWEIILNSKNKKFNFYYGEQTKTAIGRIINQIIKSSPNKIDLHSWS